MISELTEITEAAEATPRHGWIFYDEDCSLCRDLALRFELVFAKRGFHFEPLQRAWVQERLNLTAEQALEEMRVLTSAGAVFGGADAVIFLARQLWWAAPFASIARFSYIHALLDRIYRWVAAHRTCALNPGETRFRASESATNSPRQKTGRAKARPSGGRWFLLIFLPLLALGTRPFLPAWAFMWAMAFAIFFGCKWLTLGIAGAWNERGRPLRSMAYLFGWP
ncbi:MAG TPA: DUF393 domain-containing protein, partial [Chthoniobacterales bacterium]|nr:DUF393 domain-containing protein [Chthoniobacterales bacterium]